MISTSGVWAWKDVPFPAGRVIYRGGMHVVVCDGTVHIGHAPGFGNRLQSECFCADPDVIAHRATAAHDHDIKVCVFCAEKRRLS